MTRPAATTTARTPAISPIGGPGAPGAGASDPEPEPEPEPEAAGLAEPVSSAACTVRRVSVLAIGSPLSVPLGIRTTSTMSPVWAIVIDPVYGEPGPDCTRSLAEMSVPRGGATVATR